MATATKSPARRPTVAELPFENGDHMDQRTFHALYAQTPEKLKAELIGGRVYVMASPLFRRHGRPHSRVMGWLASYQAETPGTDCFDNTTAVLGDDSEPQPDACLVILPDHGGQTDGDDEDEVITGTPEFVVEVASSSASYDLHEKRDDYQRYGVREYVVYAVKARRVYWWVRRGDKYEELGPGADGIYRSEVFPGLWLDAAALARDDSKAILDTLRRGLASPEHAAFVAELASRRKSA